MILQVAFLQKFQQKYALIPNHKMTRLLISDIFIVCKIYNIFILFVNLRMN